jgi:conjugative transposon TraM protein
MKTSSLKEKRFRRMMIFIPLVVLPFVCLLFWAIAGTGQTAVLKTISGLNTALPDAQLDDKNEPDKLALYEEAAEDSLKLQQQVLNDPYYRALSTDSNANTAGAAYGTASLPQTGDPNIDLVNQRLERIYRQVDEPVMPTPGFPGAADADHLEKLLQASYGSAGADPEMAQLDGMLDKILDLQDPSRSREKLRQQSLRNKKQAYAVAPAGQSNVVTSLDRGASKTKRAPVSRNFSGNAFYEWSGDESVSSETIPAIAAAVYQTITAISGATIKLRLMDDVYIRGVLVRKGTFVYGICQLNADRLQISIQSIRYGNNLFPVNLQVYDIDGITGIYMPGAISRDVAKNAAQDAVQSVDYLSVDNSLTTQAAGIGIQAAKSLFSKKAKLVKVSVKAGYQVLLKDANTQE